MRQNGAHHHPIASVHSSDSLLLQFVLSEFILASQEILTINKSALELKTILKDRDKKEMRNGPLKSIGDAIKRLIGCRGHLTNPFILRSENSILNRLTCHSAVLLQKLSENRILKRIYSHSNQTWLYGMQAYDQVMLIQEKKQDVPTSHYKELCISLDLLLGQFLIIQQTLPELLREYTHDENVIFFLLRHKGELDGVYGNGFIKEFMKKCYKKGVNELEVFLIEQYRERGFTELLPIISTKVSELKH